MQNIAIGFAAASLCASAAMADYTDNPPTYVPLEPIADIVDTSFQSIGIQETLQMPMIDWSGDFITVYGNGGETTGPDSLFSLLEVNADLYVENDLVRQLQAYMRGDTPFMRLTQGQAMMVAPITEANDETEMVAFYKHSFSQGDHLVAREEIKDPEDLCGSDIAIMRYGPHTDFMGRILSDAGCDIEAMQENGQISWLENLSGENSPYHALVSDPEIDAAFVVTPDMLALTDGGHVPNSHNLVSTSTLSRVISDVYVVRRDYFLANREQIASLTEALFIAGEEFEGMLAGLGQSLTQDPPSLTASQQVNLGMMADVFESVPDAVEAGFFYLDADVSGYPGNVRWATETNPRGWLGLNNEVQTALNALGLSERVYTLSHAAWDYPSLSENLSNTSGVEQPTFDVSEVAALVTEQQRTGTLDSGELFSFEIFFRPDQQTFSADQYGAEFRELVDFAQAYGGAIITVEGHSDPLGYLMALDPKRFGQEGEPATRLVLRRQAQALRNLSAARATSARKALIEFAEEEMQIPMDPTQFTVVAQGIDDPKTGICDGIPCAPETEQEWLSNMRVVFRIIAVPTESSVFVSAQD